MRLDTPMGGLNFPLMFHWKTRLLAALATAFRMQGQLVQVNAAEWTVIKTDNLSEWSDPVVAR